jgi:hypothetical protein
LTVIWMPIAGARSVVTTPEYVSADAFGSSQY